MVAIPADHIADAHKLQADGIVTLWEMTPAGGGGTIRFKTDNDVEWRGNLYKGLPLSVDGDKESADGGSGQPTMVIGQANIDLSQFKPLINDGSIDGAFVVRHDVLLDNLLNNRNIKETRFYQVRRVAGYGRFQIRLDLGSYSDFLGFTMPHRQYLPPAFPSVKI